MLSFSVQGGPTTSYAYYPSGALDTIAWTPVSGYFKYAYTLNGQYQTITMPNGQSRNYSYDDQGRLLQVTNLHPTAGNLATYVYGYDLNNATGQYTRLGQRASMTCDAPSQGFSGAVTAYNYDQNYQLTQASYPAAPPFNGEVDSWTYDAIGNRLAATVNGAPQNYTYVKNGSNQLNGQRLATDGQNTYTFDANGSTLMESGPPSYTFGWDLENRVNGIAGATATYLYDYQGRRSEKAVGVTTSFLYDGVNVIGEVSQSDYVFGPGIDEPLAMNRGAVVYYLAVGPLGSTTLVNGAAGAVQAGYVFDSWGQVRNRNGALQNSFGYASREFGDAGAEWFNRNRFYDPEVGKFTQETNNGFGAVTRTSMHTLAVIRSCTRIRWDMSVSTETGVDRIGPAAQQQYVPMMDEQYAPPVDAVDGACMRHDKCYFRCREASPCNRGDRQDCVLVCNMVLATELLELHSTAGFVGTMIVAAMIWPAAPGPNGWGGYGPAYGVPVNCPCPH